MSFQTLDLNLEFKEPNDLDPQIHVEVKSDGIRLKVKKKRSIETNAEDNIDADDEVSNAQSVIPGKLYIHILFYVS